MSHEARSPDPASNGERSFPESRFPPQFSARIREQLGPEAEQFFRSLSAPLPGLRVNTLRLSAEEFAREVTWALTRLAVPEEGFIMPGYERLGRHPYHAAGLFYLQDPGAMAVGALCDAQPGDRVLDVAAAPGGKATHIGARMKGEGVLIANDAHAERARELAGNLERIGVRNAIVTAEPVDRLVAYFGGWFDRVLLDAPCSGEAMFHKSDAACADWSPAAVLGCARRQSGLLEAAGKLVRPGGRVVYSTCTFSAEENEQVVASFLDSHPDFFLAELQPVPGSSPGIPEWAPASTRSGELVRALRLWPHRLPGAGHFVAALQRSASGGESELRIAGHAVSREAVRAWSEFQRSFLTFDPAEGSVLELHGESLAALPREAPPLHGIRVLNAGLRLGRFRKGRLDPAHALAMSLRAADAKLELRLNPNSREVREYLHGEQLTADGPPGWVLVTVNGFPLGWGKRVGATLKNHYPRGLRSGP